MSEASEALNKAYATYLQDETSSAAFAPLRTQLLYLAKGAVKSVFHEHQDPNALAEDIVAEIFVALPTYHRKASFSTWAYGIAKRKAIDALRQVKGGRRNNAPPQRAKDTAAPSPEVLADLYALVNHADLTEKEVSFIRQIIGKNGLQHPLSAANRQRLSRLCKKFGLRDVTRSATN